MSLGGAASTNLEAPTAVQWTTKLPPTAFSSPGGWLCRTVLHQCDHFACYRLGCCSIVGCVCVFIHNVFAVFAVVASEITFTIRTVQALWYSGTFRCSWSLPASLTANLYAIMLRRAGLLFLLPSPLLALMMSRSPVIGQS
jgi:hypothetical protein